MTSARPERAGPRANRAATPASAYRAFRFLHLGGALAVVGALAWIGLRYDRVATPSNARHLEPVASPGATLWCVAIDEATPLGPGALVEYAGPAGARFSRIAAAPGDVLAWRTLADGGASCEVDGRALGWKVPRGTPPPLAAGPLPPGVFVLLDPSGDDGADSRALGAIPRSRLLRKVVFAGWGS